MENKSLVSALCLETSRSQFAFIFLVATGTTTEKTFVLLQGTASIRYLSSINKSKLRPVLSREKPYHYRKRVHCYGTQTHVHSDDPQRELHRVF